MMKSRLTKAFWGLCALFLISILPVSAESPGEEAINMAIVLDNSGSMAETDPENVRLIAARLMVDLLDVGDRVTIISFSTEAQLLASLTEIRGDGDRAALKSRLREATPAGNTDYRAALQTATAQLKNAPAGIPAVLFLTDGEIHPGGWDSWPSAQRDAEVRAVQEISGQFGSQGGKLFPLSFKIPQGNALLSDVSARGRGFYRQVEDVSGLTGAFQAIFSSLRGAIFQGLVEVCGQATIKVAPSMRRMIITIVGKIPGQTADLLPPSAFTGRVEMRADEKGYYKVLVVNRPTPGDWKLQTAPGQCVLVGPIEFHNVRVHWLSPQDYVATGEPLRVQLKIDQQTTQDGPWEPVRGSQVSVELARPGVQLAEPITLKGIGEGIYDGLALPAATVPGIYRLDAAVLRQGQPIYGVPPVPHYIEVGDFPQVEVSLTPDEGPASPNQVVVAQAHISGTAPIVDGKLTWQLRGAGDEMLSGTRAARGSSFRFQVPGNGAYLIALTVEGRMQSLRGLIPFKLTRERVARYMVHPPQMRLLLPDRDKFQANTPSATVPLKATFVVADEPVNLDQALITATVSGPFGWEDRFTLTQEGRGFDGLVRVERSGSYTLAVEGDAVYLGNKLAHQVQKKQFQMKLPVNVALSISSKEWEAPWGETPKQFTLRATTNAERPLNVVLRLSEPGISGLPLEITVQPGASQHFDLSLQRVGEFSPGRHEIAIRATSSEGTVDPRDLPIGVIEVYNPLVTLLLYGAGALVALALVGAVVARR